MTKAEDRSEWTKGSYLVLLNKDNLNAIGTDCLKTDKQAFLSLELLFFPQSIVRQAISVAMAIAAVAVTSGLS